MPNSPKTFDNCTSGCKTGGHATWGECMRAKAVGIEWEKSMTTYGRTEDRAWYSRLAEYRQARKAGIIPDTTKLADIRRAVDVSEKTGKPYVTTR